jgi:hypothetical protein
MRVIGGVVAAVSLLACAPAAAGASTLYVSEHPSAPGNSCAHAGFREIQTAIDEADTVPGTTIKICGGTYAEQLEITGEISLRGTAGAKVTLPAVVKDADTACDLAVDAGVAQPDEDLLSICTPGTVKLSRLTLEAKFPSDGCYDSLYNTMVGGGATLEATKVVFLDAGVEKGSVDSGCEGGVGIEVGVSGEEGPASVSKPALEVGHAVLTRDTISEYQKNGITVDGDGSSAVIGGVARSRRVTITGDGPENQGQNGIQVSRGAVANIGNVTITGNECNIAAVCGYESAAQWEEDATGVLLYLPGATSTVQKSTLSEDNVGIEYISGMPTRPATPELSLAGDRVSGGYASVQINQGNVAMKGDHFAGGLFAIDVNENEFGGGFATPSAYAPDATSTSDYLEGSKASVQVESSVGALEGKLALSGDSLVGPVVNSGHANFKITG